MYVFYFYKQHSGLLLLYVYVITTHCPQIYLLNTFGLQSIFIGTIFTNCYGEIIKIIFSKDF